MSIYEGYKIRGPYKRPDGRYHLYLDKGVERITISYPKFLIELSLGRRLTKDEIAHHKDGDVSNNSLDNLMLLTRQQHGILHRRKEGQVVCCTECGREFYLTAAKLSQRKAEQRRGKAKRGPFCSFSCRGKGSHRSA